MAKRIEPYRDYSEHEVINLFSLDTSGVSAADLQGWKSGAAAGGANDAGVVVKAGTAVLPGDLPSADALKRSGALRDYLGASGQPHVGFNAYPVVEMTMGATGAGEDALALGLTLKETLAYDENGENLLRYPLKKDELQAVLPGQASPILVRGLVLLNSDAFDVAPTVGQGLICAADGKLSGDAAGTLGQCLAVNDSDGAGTATKYLCKVSFA
jgi:hypothetical protein